MSERERVDAVVRRVRGAAFESSLTTFARHTVLRSFELLSTRYPLFICAFSRYAFWLPVVPARYYYLSVPPADLSRAFATSLPHALSTSVHILLLLIRWRLLIIRPCCPRYIYTFMPV